MATGGDVKPEASATLDFGIGLFHKAPESQLTNPTHGKDMNTGNNGSFPFWPASWRDTDGIVGLLLAIFLFLNPFPHTTSTKEICFYSALTLFVGALIWRRQRPLWRSPLAWPMMAISAWSLAGLFFALDVPGSIHDLLAHWLKYIGLYLMLINLWDSFDRLNLIGRLLTISGTFYTIGAMVVWYGVLGHPFNSRMGNYVTMGTTIFGYVILLSLVIALHLGLQSVNRPRRWTYLAAALVLAVAAVLTQSRGTLLALVLTLSVFFLHRFWRVLVIWLIAIGLTLAMPQLKTRLYSPGDHYTVRVGHLYYSLEVIRDYPVIGTGFAIDTFRDARRLNPETYMARIPEAYRNPAHPYLWPHNMFLSVGVRLGLVGVALFAWLWFVAFRQAWRLARGSDPPIKAWGRCIGAALAMFFTKAFFDPFETHMVETILFTIFALLTIVWRRQQALLGARPLRL